jgi:hypothetical protein
MYSGEHDMRRDDLMKPDLLSETVLTVTAAAIIVFLISTLWLAMVGH